MAMTTPERELEESLIEKLRDLKYEYRSDIRDRARLEANFREKFEALNRVRLTDGEFRRLIDEIVTPDVYEAARSLRNREAFTRDDGTPLNYTLVNIKDWCKNHFEVVNQLRINTDNSHHRYDVMLLINGVPVVQIELKSLGISLSGHFKTGQRWSLQNRPTGMARDGVVLPLWDWTRQARFSPPTPRAAFEDVAVMEQPVQHGCDGGAITQ